MTAEAAYTQRVTALGHANKVRAARAELKQRVREGETSAAAVVLTDPWEADTMTVYDLLRCQRGWGKSKAKRFLRALPVSETRTVGSLRERERQGIASKLHGGLRALRDAEESWDAQRWAAGRDEAA